MESQIKEDNIQPGLLEGIRLVRYDIFHAGPGASALLGEHADSVLQDVGYAPSEIEKLREDAITQ